jgi:hypothetical protein
MTSLVAEIRKSSVLYLVGIDVLNPLLYWQDHLEALHFNRFHSPLLAFAALAKLFGLS